jgi:hypothetical protein
MHLFHAAAAERDVPLVAHAPGKTAAQWPQALHHTVRIRPTARLTPGRARARGRQHSVERGAELAQAVGGGGAAAARAAARRAGARRAPTRPDLAAQHGRRLQVAHLDLAVALSLLRARVSSARDGQQLLA